MGKSLDLISVESGRISKLFFLYLYFFDMCFFNSFVIKINFKIYLELSNLNNLKIYDIFFPLELRSS